MSRSLFSLYLWSLCHLELTRLQPVRGSCDTNHNSAFILLYQPHPLSRPLFFPLVTHCHSLFYLLYPPWLALFFPSPSSLTVLSSLTFVPSPPNYSFIRFGKPLTNPLLSPPSTAEHPLEHGQKKQKTESHCAQPYSTQR